MGVYSNYNNKSQILNEVYFGTSPQLESIIKQLGVYRNKLMIDSVFKSYELLIRSNLKDCNRHPDLIKFNRMIEDFFGFNTFSLLVDSYSCENAYTFGVQYRANSDTRYRTKITKTGFRYDKDSDMCCFVYIFAGIIFNNNYTDREVMAIILHEIGHNFSANFDNSIMFKYNYQKLLKPILMITILINSVVSISSFDIMGAQMNFRSLLISKNFAEIYLKIKEEISKNPSIEQYFYLLNINFGSIVDIEHAFLTPSLFIPDPMSIIRKIKSIIANLFTDLIFIKVGYTDEK